MTDAIATRPTSALDRSESIGELAGALAKASADFKPVEKDAEASFETKKGALIKFRYATLGNVYKAVRPGLSKNGLSVVHQCNEGALVSLLIHSSGEWISSTIPIGHPDEWKQYGGALTYAKRYATAGLLAVAADEDTDVAGLEGLGPDRDKAPPARAEKSRRAPAPAERQRSIHEGTSPAQADPKAPVIALMDKLDMQPDERIAVWTDFDGDYGAAAEHLTAVVESREKPRTAPSQPEQEPIF